MRADRLLHVMSGLEVGGRERVVLELARRARRDGLDHRLVLFDIPFRSAEIDLDPGAVPWEFVPRGPGLDLRFAFRLAAATRRHEARVLHAHNDTAIFYACAATMIPGGPRPAVIGTFHTRPHASRRGGRHFTRFASRRAACMTAVSHELADAVVDGGWCAGPCRVIENGIDLVEFQPAGAMDVVRSRLGLANDAFVVALVARCDPVKRQIDLIQAAKRLSGRSPPIHVVLVGEGPTLPSLKDAAKSLAHVHFVGRVQDVAAFFRGVDAVVLCSDHEAMPRVLLESMACGRPVIATSVGGVPAMLRATGSGAGEDCGILVPPRDPERLALEILRLAGDPGLRIALGAAARRRSADFSADRQYANYAALYAEFAGAGA